MKSNTAINKKTNQVMQRGTNQRWVKARNKTPIEHQGKRYHQ